MVKLNVYRHRQCNRCDDTIYISKLGWIIFIWGNETTKIGCIFNFIKNFFAFLLF